MLEAKLQNLNFKPKEVKLYLALLELGEANMERLVAKSGLKRATTYDVIESLKKKGFIAITKKAKKTFYYAENPNQIGKLLDEKKKYL